jgi:hypothetical protein
MGNPEQLGKRSNIQLTSANFFDDPKATRMSQHGKHISKFSAGNTSERHGFSVVGQGEAYRTYGYVSPYSNI